MIVGYDVIKTSTNPYDTHQGEINCAKFHGCTLSNSGVKVNKRTYVQTEFDFIDRFTYQPALLSSPAELPISKVRIKNIG